MSSLDCTRRIVDLAEQLSGRPVRVQEDSTLSVLATVKMARGNAPMHLISYRPIRGRQPDYHICYQCGFIIRLFETPLEARFDFAQSPDASRHMDSLLANSSLPSNIRTAKEMLMNGLLTQLRSVPIGLRIDDWLWTTCPDVRDEQIASCRLQLQDNTQVLAPSVRHSFPKKIVAANTAMNAAFALSWAAKLNDESILLPYRSIGAATDGKALLDIFHNVSPNPSSDCDLVDRWAEQLGLSGWYLWKPYKLDI
jgi:hypothetical protein